MFNSNLILKLEFEFESGQNKAMLFEFVFEYILVRIRSSESIYIPTLQEESKSWQLFREINLYHHGTTMELIEKY